MAQPISKRIKEKHPTADVKKFNTLLIDGSNLLEVSFRGYKKTNSQGKEIGGIFQFLLQIKMMLQKGNFRYVYCMWDGDNSGNLKFEINPSYKANRDKTYDEDRLSSYMQEVNKRIKQMYSHNKRNAKTEDEKELFHWQRNIVIQCLEELCIRQCLCDYIEADDLIGYYVTHKKPNERIVIVSNDRDLTQLISEDVIVYIQSLHQFVNTKNHTDIIGYNYQNVLLKKILCGDTSDNIKGIKGLGEKTLLDNFSEIKERKVELNEIINKADEINKKRIQEKKKPLKWAENIVNRITDGIQGEDIYESNRKIIDLKNPLMTQESIDTMNSIMYAPMDTTDRSLNNLYKILQENCIEELLEENKFSSFFLEFKYIIDNEKKGGDCF